MRSAVRWAFVAAALSLAALGAGLHAGCAPTPATPDRTLATNSEAPGTSRPAPGPTSVEGMRIRVPRLGIDLPLHEGDVARDVPTDTSPGATAEGAAFHLPGTSTPGDGGNTFIYAHARMGMFLALWHADVGDRVEVVLPDGRVLAYKVTEVHPRVPSSDTSWLRPTSDERLTLQTSTGPTPGYPRFLVVARREPQT